MAPVGLRLRERGQVAPGEVARRPRLLRAPLVPVAAALVAGIVAGRYVPLPAGVWGVGGAAALGAAAAMVLRRRLHKSPGPTGRDWTPGPAAAACLAACVLCLGAAWARLAAASVDDGDLVTYSPPRGRSLATVRGQVVTAPHIYHPSPAVRFGYCPQPRTAFVMRAREIRTSGGWRPASGLARVTIRQADDRLRAGQDVELMGWLRRPAPPANPGQFDRAAAAVRTRVLSEIDVAASDGVTIRRGARQAWYERVAWRLRAAARQHLSHCGEGEGGRLLSALVIGERHPSLRRLSRTMARTGVAHFLSISGLHLGIFLGFVYLLCRLAAVPPRRAAVIVLVVLAAYVLLAEPRRPLLRSAIMAAALCAAVIFRRRLQPLNALALAAIILLAFDPLQAFHAGFQLSFTIVAGLILLHAPVRSALFGRLLRRRGLTVFRDEHRTARRLQRVAGNWLMNAVVLSLLAYLMAAPLVAYHFGFFSPYAPLLSLLLLPIVTAVLVPGYLSVALAWPMPNLSYAIGRLSAAAAAGLARLVEQFEHLPASCLELREVPAGWAVLCYAAVGLVAQRRRLPLGRAFAAGAVVALAGWTAWTQRVAPRPASAELHVLAVGAGQCAVLRSPDGGTYVFDAGTQSGFDAHGAVIAPFLRHERLPAPRAAFISHANTDHYGAVPGLLGRGGLRRVYLNDYFGRGGTDEEPEGPQPARLLEMVRAAGAEVVRVRAGQKVALGEDVAVEVLWPPAARREDLAADANETSLVLRVTCGGRSVLLTGDVGAVAQAALCAEPRVRADVLLMPHHGGWTQERLADGRHVVEAFVEAVRPEVVLLSGSREPRAGPPDETQRREFYARLRSGYRYHSTPRHGWIRVRFGDGGISVATMR
jgi:competence protein ComEC